MFVNNGNPRQDVPTVKSKAIRRILVSRSTAGVMIIGPNFHKCFFYKHLLVIYVFTRVYTFTVYSKHL